MDRTQVRALSRGIFLGDLAQGRSGGDSHFIRIRVVEVELSHKRLNRGSGAGAYPTQSQRDLNSHGRLIVLEDLVAQHPLDDLLSMVLVLDGIGGANKEGGD